jgi:hypothetical protein
MHKNNIVTKNKNLGNEKIMKEGSDERNSKRKYVGCVRQPNTIH